MRSIVDSIHDGDFEHVPAILSAVQSLGPSLSEHFHLITPAICSLLRPGLEDIPDGNQIFFVVDLFIIELKTKEPGLI